jgi:hypothetical protein
VRLLAAALVAAVGAVHFEQYVDFMSEVHTVGVLFLLNASGAAAIAVALLSSDPLLRRLAGAGGIALCVGSLVSILLSAGGGVFGYQEPDWRMPMVLAVIFEALALPALAAVLVGRGHRAATVS